MPAKAFVDSPANPVSLEPSPLSLPLSFSIANWSAWAANLTTKQNWQEWQEHACLPDHQDLSLPPLPQVPAMQRRRLSPFAKVALHCALDAVGSQPHTMPVVFASRHGDLARTNKLIESVAANDELSPTQFGLSVHNAVAGLYSILTHNTAAISSVAAGEATFMAGLLDAVCKLHTHPQGRLLYLYCDLPVPECYQGYLAPQAGIGLALLLEKRKDNDFTLGEDNNNSSPDNAVFDFIRFLLGKSGYRDIPFSHGRWQIRHTKNTPS